MTLNEIVYTLHSTGKNWLLHPPESCIHAAISANPWFTELDIRFALQEVATWLSAENLEEFISQYDLPKEKDFSPTIGLILAGNIPAAGFHDVLVGLLSGANLRVKCSHLDSVLIPAFYREVFPSLKTLVFTEGISGVDALIASGTSLTGLYLKSQFEGIPMLIRGNRFSLAILKGDESLAELDLLAADILRYNGMGCRNVSNLMVPSDWKGREVLWQALMDYKNRQVLSAPYLRKVAWEQGIENWRGNNQDVLLPVCWRESLSLSAVETGVLQVVAYHSFEDRIRLMEEVNHSVQCVVGKESWVGFGVSQCPGLMDYADGVDTMEWIRCAHLG